MVWYMTIFAGASLMCRIVTFKFKILCCTAFGKAVWQRIFCMIYIKWWFDA